MTKAFSPIDENTQSCFRGLLNTNFKFLVGSIAPLAKKSRHVMVEMLLESKHLEGMRDVCIMLTVDTYIATMGDKSRL